MPWSAFLAVQTLLLGGLGFDFGGQCIESDQVGLDTPRSSAACANADDLAPG